MNIKLDTWNYEVNNDEQVKLVLSGSKNTRVTLYSDDRIVNVGDENVLIFDNEKQACVTKVKEVIVTEFKNLDEDSKKYCTNDQFDDDTLVQVVTFEVIRNLVEERLDLAQKIVDHNKDIFGDYSQVSEINAGFNNSIFNVDNRYVIKVCGNIDKEDLFDTEYKFYQENQDSEIIPKLYRYDNSKSIVPFVYEIMECVNGKSVYYYWYKMNEQEREKLIEKLMNLIKKIHVKTYPEFDWVSYIKSEVMDKFNKSLDLLTEEEQQIILKSLELYDEVLADSHFTLIHNDLHFDNILITEDNEIKLIDFNDSMIAPFDYDLRIFYMCVDRPWKWANTEMDPYQKPEDYINIFEYVKKYYEELSKVKYLDERMIVYAVLSDIRHLPRFRDDEVKKSVVDNSRKLINKLS